MNYSECGGCEGKGSHSRRCRAQPGWFWERLYDQADSLGDRIGANDPEAANMAYTIAARMRGRSATITAKARGIERGQDNGCI